MHQAPLVSLADLNAAGIRLRPVEAVTLTRAIAKQVVDGDLPGVPSAHVLRLGADGRLAVEGPVETGGRSVPRAAQLLDTLLPGFDAPTEFRASGALRLTVARALRTLDLPAYPSLDSFIGALGRFAVDDPEAVVRDIVKRWAAVTTAVAPEAAAADDVPPADATPAAGGVLAQMTPAATALTISDIRRARRATGLTLSDISARSRIPAWLVRELEWGYFRNWPAGHDGRTQLVRYARAAGLDDHVVIRTVWPLISREALSAGRAIVPAMEWHEEEVWPDWNQRVAEFGDTVETVEAETVEVVDPPRRSARRRALAAAFAIPALLAIGIMTAALQREQWSGLPATGVESSVAVPSGEPQVAQTRSGVPAERRNTEETPPAPVRSASAPQTSADRAPRPSPAPALATDRPSVASAAPEKAGVETPAYSPSFSAVEAAVFYHTSAQGQSALMRADTDSRGAVLRVTSVLDDDASNFHPRPSPDGTRIAFDSDREGERAVYVAQADGSDVRRVSGEGFAAIPSWSPDGQILTYVRGEPGRPQVWNLWATDLTTGETRRLTSYKVGQPWGASWFPDGRRIAYSHETRLVIRDVHTGAERVFQSPIKGRLVRTPAVSPDGSQIMFQVYRDGAWLMDVSDGSMRKVLSDPTAEEYTWAPDGRRVAYHSRQSGAWGVWVMASR